MPRMTNEEALDILERKIECDNDNCPEPGMSCSECPYNVDAIDYARARKMAIEALSKQCASTEQADKKLFGHGYWLFPGEVFISHNVLNEVLDTIIKSTNTEPKQPQNGSICTKTAENDEDRTTNDQITDSDKMVDQFCDITKKTDDVLLNRDDVIKAVDRHTRDDGTLDDDISCILEEVSLSEQEKSNSFSKEPSESSDSEMNCSDVPDFHAGKTNFQPGDKFILELGQERRMFGEFEIKGTDLYVKTSLLEKLTRYEPETVTNCHDLISKRNAYLALVEKGQASRRYKLGETWELNGKEIREVLDALPFAQSKKIPYKKPEIIYCKDCRYRDPEDKKCDHGHGIVWQLPRPDDWFCADGKR